MNTLHINLSDNTDIKSVCKKAFPNYRGRKFAVSFGVKKTSVRSYWSSGSRSQYVLVRLSDLTTHPAPTSHPVFNNVSVDVDNVIIPDGYVIVEHRISRGKDMGLTILTPHNPPLLPTDNDLSYEHKEVLFVTRSRKSSYAGIKDYRAYELRNKHGWSLAYINQLRTELINMGYLAKNKAITNKGKNIVGSESWLPFIPKQ